MIDKKVYRENISNFLKNEFKANYNEIIKSRIKLKAVWLKAGEQGFFRGVSDVAYGGYDDPEYSNIILEELGNAHLLDFPLWLQGSVMSNFFDKYGTVEQKEIYLTALISGKKLGAIAMTEEQSGSDISAFTTNAKTTEEGYILNGVKKYIGCGTIADFYLIASRIDNSDAQALFIVDKNTAGVKVRTLINESSLKALDLAEITLNNVVLSKESLLGNRKNASVALLRTLTIERYSGSMIAHVMSKSLLKIGATWAKNRVVNGSSIYSKQHINFKFAEFYSNVVVHDAFMNELSKTFEKKAQIQLKDAAIAKYKIVNELILICTFLSRLFGAKAVINELEIDAIHLLNDAIAQSIAGGTEEIMKIIIAKSL